MSIDDKDTLMTDPRGGKRKTLYPFDKILLQRVNDLLTMLTPDVLDSVRQTCINRNIPYIDIETYFAIFNIGMARISNTTPELAVWQCLQAENPEAVDVAPSLAKTLMCEYENKLIAMRRIRESHAEHKFVVDVDENDLHDARVAYDEFIQHCDMTAFGGIVIAEQQRELLKQIIVKARKDVLPKIQKAAAPVIRAGMEVMSVAYELLGIQSDEGRQFPKIDLLPPSVK